MSKKGLTPSVEVFRIASPSPIKAVEVLLILPLNEERVCYL
jgi:hypothetical protein